MLARVEEEVPEGDGWRYEPKWDGFRALIFLEPKSFHIESRGSKPMQRYFPELEPVLRAALPSCVIDGEIVVPTGGHLDFDALLQRIHPAESRVRMLAEKTPATFVAFDLLATARADLRKKKLSERWSRLEKLLEGTERGFDPVLEPGPRVVLTPQTSERSDALRWLEELEASGLDGIIAKKEDLPYRPGERVMVKVKRQRTADVVVGGYRMARDGDGVGSLLLGLYDDDGTLYHVGFAASFRKAERRALLEKLKPYEGGDAFGVGFGPGGPNRWRQNAEETEFVPLRPELVVEIAFDHVTGHRFRHGTRILRWRDDKKPRACTLDQMLPAGSR